MRHRLYIFLSFFVVDISMKHTEDLIVISSPG